MIFWVHGTRRITKLSHAVRRVMLGERALCGQMGFWTLTPMEGPSLKTGEMCSRCLARLEGQHPEDERSG